MFSHYYYYYYFCIKVILQKKERYMDIIIYVYTCLYIFIYFLYEKFIPGYVQQLRDRNIYNMPEKIKRDLIEKET